MFNNNNVSSNYANITQLTIYAILIASCRFSFFIPVYVDLFRIWASLANLYLPPRPVSEV